MDEMTPLRLALFLADGRAWFAGFGLLALSVVLQSVGKRRGRTIARLLTFVGVVLIVLSTTPAPPWFYAAAIIVFLAWAAPFPARKTKPNSNGESTDAVKTASSAQGRTRKIAAAAMLLVCAGAAAIEWPHYALPALNVRSVDRIYVIGDSLSSGLGDETTWPKMLSSRANLPVVNLAKAGAQVSHALSQAQKLEPGPALVLIEIGGNDVMGYTTAVEFERNLRVLLEAVKSPERRMAMFELPLPPLKHAFGAIQRRLAAEYGVTMIPKRVLAEVVRAPDATMDGLHLSQSGHAAMAKQVYQILCAASD